MQLNQGASHTDKTNSLHAHMARVYRASVAQESICSGMRTWPKRSHGVGAYRNKGTTMTQTLNIPKMYKNSARHGASGNPLETYQPMAIVHATDETTNFHLMSNSMNPL
jgi:hypothetical protein